MRQISLASSRASGVHVLVLVRGVRSEGVRFVLGIVCGLHVKVEALCIVAHGEGNERAVGHEEAVLRTVDSEQARLSSARLVCRQHVALEWPVRRVGLLDHLPNWLSILMWAY